MLRFLLLVFLFISATHPLSSSEQKIPSYLIERKFINDETYLLIRWVNYTEDQKKKIYDLLTPFKEKEISDENKSKIEKIIKENITAEQTKSYEAKKEQKKNFMAEFNEIQNSLTKKLGDLNINKEKDEKLYNIMIHIGLINFREVWSLMQLRLSDSEKDKLFYFLSDLIQQDYGVFYTNQMDADTLNRDYNNFAFTMKKDYGTEQLNKKISEILSKENLSIYEKLNKLYDQQKERYKKLYQKYGPALKIELPITIKG